MIKNNKLKFTFWRTMMLIIGIFFIISFVHRFAFGLGASTNLSDAFPWGLWIGFDLLVGVGLSAGGFVIAATVHIFGLEDYKPIARPAILTAFLGYMMVVVALLFDLGLPWRIWHPLIYWNHHSVMFEVGWCVTLYTTVLAMEFSPMLFERFGWKVPLKIVRAAYIPLVVFGFLLSTMHQSSLGSLYLIVPGKMHALWYSSMLPIHFFISAVSVGLSMTIIESYLSHRAFRRELEPHLLSGLARVAVVVLGVYGTLRIADLINTGAISEVFKLTRESILFYGEFGLGIIAPIILYSRQRIRQDRQGLFFAALLAISGFILNRMNVSVTSMVADSGTNYFPSWMEVSVSLGIVVLGFLGFGAAVRYLKVFPSSETTGPMVIRRPTMVWGTRVLFTTWALVIIGVALFTLSPQPPLKANPNLHAETAIVEGSDLEGLPPDLTFPMGEDSMGEVVFSHVNHADSMESFSCTRCHTNAWSIIPDGKIKSNEYTYKDIHEGNKCFSCHDGESAFEVATECESCHQ